jgi:tRNA nucleotidyltransferase/poly(A) polymerase
MKRGGVNNNNTLSTTMKRVKFHHVPTTTTTTTEEQEHNIWRIDSLNNPLWGIRKRGEHITNGDFTKQSFTDKSQLLPYRFNFHSSLLLAQKNANEVYTIHITEHEQKIFDFLLTVNETYTMKTVLRVAGGWVRNKLLNMEGKDIDIALDNCMGIEFAMKVLDYEKKNNLPDQHHSIGVISANPDQSKHLETATTHILGEPIDFVNLRCEEYAENCDHRIPSSIKVGTPEEDAFRRDLTINSLFYNINENKIEDLTKQGVDDLRQGIIRTPLPSLRTFLDDPLRILRAVRFAAQFNFIVADELIVAARNESVTKALAEKVSRERVGIEVGKMIKGEDPVGAFALINECKVRHIVFSLSTHVQKNSKQAKLYENPIPIQWTDQQWDNALFRMRFVYKQAQKHSLSEDQTSVLLMAATLSNVVPREYLPSIDRKDVDEYIISDQLFNWCDNLLCVSLKFPMKFRADVITILYGAHLFSQLLVTTVEDQKKYADVTKFYSELIHSQRVHVAKVLRVIKENYIQACLLTSVYQTEGIEFTELQNVYLNERSEQHSGELLMNSIGTSYDSKFTNVINMKYVLDGKEVAAAAQVRPGEILTHINRDLMDWQLEYYPQIISQDQSTTKQQATQFIQGRGDKYQELESKLNLQRANNQVKKKKIH